MREWEYTKGYSVGGLIFQLGDPVESNERLTDFAFATTTVQRERFCDFYKVNDLTFTLSDTESGKELEVWGADNITYKDLITEGLYTEELYTGIHTAGRFFEESFGVMDWEHATFTAHKKESVTLGESVNTVISSLKYETAILKEWYQNKIAAYKEEYRISVDIERNAVWRINRTFEYAVQMEESVSFGIVTAYGEEISIESRYLPTWLITRVYDESIEIEEEEENRWTISRIFAEIATFFDTVLRKIVGFFIDETSVQDEYSPAWQANRKYSEQAELEDYIRKGIRARTAEVVNIGDELKREINTISYEGVAISDTLRSNVLSRQYEFIYPKEKVTSAIESDYEEQVKITDTVKNQWESYRDYDESVNISDKFFSNYQDNIEENIGAKDVRIRPTTNGILSNIIISEKEMSYEDFQKNADQIGGYAPFIEFKVGDYEYKNAVYRMVLSRTNINSTPLFYGYEVHVDIPDTIDRGECAVSGETKVYFNKHYYHAPEINVTTTGGTEVLIPRIVSIDNEDDSGRYFTVILENLSGESKSGRISWSARGY